MTNNLTAIDEFSWKKNGKEYSGSNFSTIVISTNRSDNGTTYTCAAKSKNGSRAVSDPFTVIIVGELIVQSYVMKFSLSVCLSVCECYSMLVCWSGIGFQTMCTTVTKLFI